MVLTASRDLPLLTHPWCGCVFYMVLCILFRFFPFSMGILQFTTCPQERIKRRNECENVVSPKCWNNTSVATHRGCETAVGTPHVWQLICDTSVVTPQLWHYDNSVVTPHWWTLQLQHLRGDTWVVTPQLSHLSCHTLVVTPRFVTPQLSHLVLSNSVVPLSCDPSNGPSQLWHPSLQHLSFDN
jgi:hypothetical protein